MKMAEQLLAQLALKFAKNWFYISMTSTKLMHGHHQDLPLAF